MTIPNPQSIVDRLIAFQSTVRDTIIASRTEAGDLNEVSRSSSADTIYKIDTEVDPLLEAACEEWGKLDAPGRRWPRVWRAKTATRSNTASFHTGHAKQDAKIRLIIDPIDGTRGIMYDKRAAWAWPASRRIKAPATRLTRYRNRRHDRIAHQQDGPSQMCCGPSRAKAPGQRIDLKTGQSRPFALSPSKATTIDHGFASRRNFFPGTKVLAADVMEHLAANLIGPADVTRATVFDDQYICTGGQFYELIVGHDRFNADLRPLFYKIQNQPEGLCCHPYDCATLP